MAELLQIECKAKPDQTIRACVTVAISNVSYVQHMVEI